MECAGSKLILQHVGVLYGIVQNKTGNLVMQEREGVIVRAKFLKQPEGMEART